MSDKDTGTERKSNGLLLFVAACLLSITVFHFTGVLDKTTAGILTFIHVATPSVSSVPPPSATAMPSASTASTAEASSASPFVGCVRDSYVCRCQDEGTRCIKLIVSTDGIVETMTFVCSGGLYVRDHELKLYGGVLYRNECRPQGRPALKSCRLGEDCDVQGLQEGWPCSPDKDEVAVCRCGLVLNFTTPDMRENLSHLRCPDYDNCEPPPTDFCEPPQFGPRDPISL